MTFAARDAFSAAVARPPGFQPVTRMYRTLGTFTETAPAGATSLTLQVGGPGGGGGLSGGASGGWCQQVIPLTASNLSFAVVITPGGAPAQTGVASSVVGGGFNLVAGAGAGDGGQGGVASGGSTLISGNQGTPTAGGAAVVGIISSGAGGAPGAAGQAGAAAFAYR